MSSLSRQLLHSNPNTANGTLKLLQTAFPHDSTTFRIDGSKVEILSEPVQFYDRLVQGSRSCKNRITFSSLYFGTGHKEVKLMQAMQERLNSNPDLQITLLFDYTRGTRRDKDNISCADLLQDLVTDRSRVNFFLSPQFSQLFNKYFILPIQKKNEIISLQHMKCFIIDNDVIISGANLSDQYFENRADRYIVFPDCKALADYLDDLVKTVSSFSLSLSSDGTFSMHDSMQYHPLTRQQRMDFVKEARSRILEFKDRHRKLNEVVVGDGETSVTPLIQMKEFGITDDTDFTCKLLSSLPERTSLKMASGYFNLTQHYQNILLEASKKVDIDILFASEQVNSFYGAKGLIGYVPSFYTAMSRHFLEQTKNANSSIKLWSFYRPNWTFHSKGLWIKAIDEWFVSMIGSSNFGYRSAYKDLELQVVLVTKDPSLQQKLTDEQENLWKYGRRVHSLSDLPDVPVWLRMMSQKIKSFF